MGWHTYGRSQRIFWSTSPNRFRMQRDRGARPRPPRSSDLSIGIWASRPAAKVDLCRCVLEGGRELCDQIVTCVVIGEIGADPVGPAAIASHDLFGALVWRSEYADR